MINFRYWLFKAKDTCTGNNVSDQINDIQKLVTYPFSEESVEIRKARLDNLLNYALTNVSFYKSQNIINSNQIDCFPVLDKNLIRDHIEDFFADGINKDNLFRVVTSGSTGTPFSVFHDKVKRLRNTCDTIYFGKLSGFSLGVKLYYLKIWNDVNRKSNFSNWKQNIRPIDVMHLSDHNMERLLYKFSSNSQPKAFLGYSSALESIAELAISKKLTLKIKNVKSIIAMSEGLNSIAKIKIQEVFGKCPVSRYSNVENGIIAQQLPDGSNEFVVNWASYYVEILDFNSNIPKEVGELGRIVVTDLFNYSMPIIRYDTGDIGLFVWSKNKKQLLLSGIEGRRMDQVFNTKGDLVSSFTITNSMWLYPEIKQYQFIQLSKNEYLFKLNVNGKFERENLLVSEFKNYFGENAKINVEYVNEIPLLNSGKRKKVMNISMITIKNTVTLSG